ncbi:4-hydroxy-tetrahydrodipicolinate synthase [Bacteroidia bacterium]|nr:4-hydroxy-tetrahydrodipicolinate synthase [Bacteroidia bacterium]GHT47492.1 4-hydroxy-tetrahydrodipicolinate synthase [Bacteroidia bacterium]
MGQMNLKGMGVALITPFKRDGNVDYAALERITDYLLQNGADYLVVLGTTAETPTLTPDEQKEIIRLVINQVKGKIPVVLGLGGNNTFGLVQKLKTDDFTGIDAILSVVPYYNKPTQEGIYQHYKHIATASSLPVILYNVPGRTGVNMTAETTLRLAHEFDNIVAIKEASGNMTQISAIIKQKPHDFQVISGDDSMAFPQITCGAVGIISVLGNAFPKEFSRMVHLALSGDCTNALAIHHRFTELFELLFVDGSPAGVKSILHQMGYIENELRLPLIPTQITTYEKIKKILKELDSKS